MRLRAFLSLLLMPLGGCSTFVHSELDNGTKEGIRYSLPVPFLQVTPKPDGTIENSIIYLPDPKATYVLRTKSLVSSYTLDVQLQNQMLKSVSLNAKSDAVAVALADSAANVAKARIEANAKADEEAKKADADAAKALADAELAVRVASVKVTVLTDGKAASDAILAAKVEEQAAIVKRDALLKAKDGASASLDAANAPGADQARMVAGPMLFRIVPDGEGVKLVAVKGPTAFATSDAVRAQAAMAFQPSGIIPVKPDKDGILQFEISVNRTVEIDQPEIYAAASPAQTITGLKPTASKKTDAAGTKITIVLKPATPAGDYAILLPVTPSGAAKSSRQIDIQVTK